MPGQIGQRCNWLSGKSLSDKDIPRLGKKPLIDAEFCIMQFLAEEWPDWSASAFS